jgi:hypothetical protein
MPVERAASGTSLVDVLDRVLDKGIVIDAWVRVSLVGIDLITSRRGSWWRPSIPISNMRSGFAGPAGSRSLLVSQAMEVTTAKTVVRVPTDVTRRRARAREESRANDVANIPCESLRTPSWADGVPPRHRGCWPLRTVRSRLVARMPV